MAGCGEGCLADVFGFLAKLEKLLQVSVVCQRYEK